MTNHRTTVLIADSRTAVRESLAALLSTDPAFVIAGSAGSGSAALREAAHKQPDLILIDPNFGRQRGWEVISSIKGLRPDSIILVHTNEMTAEQLLEAIQRGASDIIHKALPPDQLLERMKMAQARQFLVNPAVAGLLLTRLQAAAALPLSPRPLVEAEYRLLQLAARYPAVGDIARDLGEPLPLVYTTIASVIEKIQFAFFTGTALSRQLS